MDCEVCPPSGDLWLRFGGRGGGSSYSCSQDSENDLAVMVSDFLENNINSSGSYGTESWCSSDGDSASYDLAQLPHQISFYKLSMDDHENDLLSLAHSILLSMNMAENVGSVCKSGLCNASCIRYALAKLLRLSGYDAAICVTKWLGSGKVPGGDHEYIDVINSENGNSDRLIIDVDFRSHFEIARAVESYDRILDSLPIVYVGSLTKLKQYLSIMVEAARSSLKQNSMPLPPWRSLAYLQAKWQSPHERRINQDEHSRNITDSSDHRQCHGHLKRLKSALQQEIEAERLLKPVNRDVNRRMKFERWRHSSYSAH